MKKHLLATLLITTLFTFSNCSKSENNIPQQPELDVTPKPGQGRILIAISRAGVHAEYRIVRANEPDKDIRKDVIGGRDNNKPLKDCRRQPETWGNQHDLDTGEYIVFYLLKSTNGTSSEQLNFKVEESKCTSINLLGYAWGS